MSVIVAIKKNDKIYMGTDTQVSCGSRKWGALNEENRKIRRFENGILLGAVGSQRGAMLVSSHPEIFTLPEDGRLTKEHVVTKIVPEITKLFREADQIERNKGRIPRWPCTFLLAHGDTLFEITRERAVISIHHFSSIGIGCLATFSALMKMDGETLCDDDAVNEGLLKALRISAVHLQGIGAPYFLIDTERKEFQIAD